MAWSYLSMLWAQYPGLALDGANRALMYLLISQFGDSSKPLFIICALVILGSFAMMGGVAAVMAGLKSAASDAKKSAADCG